MFFYISTSDDNLLLDRGLGTPSLTCMILLHEITDVSLNNIMEFLCCCWYHLLTVCTVLLYQGTDLFKGKSYGEAAAQYLQAAEFGDDDADLQEACFNNVALCYLKVKKWVDAITYATKSLEKKPEGNGKAHFRRATAYIEVGKFAEAKQDLKAAQEIDPDSKSIKKLSTKLAKAVAHRRGSDAMSVCRLGHACLGEQCIQGYQQVDVDGGEVEVGHELFISISHVWMRRSTLLSAPVAPSLNLHKGCAGG